MSLVGCQYFRFIAHGGYEEGVSTCYSFPNDADGEKENGPDSRASVTVKYSISVRRRCVCSNPWLTARVASIRFHRLQGISAKYRWCQPCQSPGCIQLSYLFDTSTL